MEQEGALKLCKARGVSAHAAKVKEGGTCFSKLQVEQEGALELCEARGVSAHTAKVKEGGDVI